LAPADLGSPMSGLCRQPHDAAGRRIVLGARLGSFGLRLVLTQLSSKSFKKERYRPDSWAASPEPAAAKKPTRVDRQAPLSVHHTCRQKRLSRAVCEFWAMRPGIVSEGRAGPVITGNSFRYSVQRGRNAEPTGRYEKRISLAFNLAIPAWRPVPIAAAHAGTRSRRTGGQGA